MPVMDGFAFLHAFRDLPGCRDIPVIVITARDLTRADRDSLQTASKVLSKGETSIKNRYPPTSSPSPVTSPPQLILLSISDRSLSRVLAKHP